MHVALNLPDAKDSFLLGKNDIILDRYPFHTKQFWALLKNGGAA